MKPIPQEKEKWFFKFSLMVLRRYLARHVPVKSKLQHPPPPPRVYPGHLTVLTFPRVGNLIRMHKGGQFDPYPRCHMTCLDACTRHDERGERQENNSFN